MPYRTHSNPNSGPSRRSASPGRRPRRRGWIRGTVVELDADAGRLVVLVAEASRAARRLQGAEVAADLVDAELRVPDADGDRSASLRDVFPGNRVEIRFSGADPAGVLNGRTLIHLGPRMPTGGLRRLWS